MTRRTKIPPPPTHFAILVSPDGCVRGSAWAEYIGDLAEDLKPGWVVRVVDRAEWTARAEPCLKDRCSHGGGL